jgi:hypothetical protein
VNYSPTECKKMSGVNVLSVSVQPVYSGIHNHNSTKIVHPMKWVIQQKFLCFISSLLKLYETIRVKTESYVVLWIRIRIKMKGRIRIRIKLISWIRIITNVISWIRIKVKVRFLTDACITVRHHMSQ